MFKNSTNPGILAEYSGLIKLAEIEAICAPRLAALERPHWACVRELFAKLPPVAELSGIEKKLRVDFSSPVVRVGHVNDLSPEQHELLRQIILKLIPWRKGPFELFGHSIDAEWRSDLKWDRLAPHLGDLGGKRILDVGCNNGYYMWRMVGHQDEPPECVIGIDPSESFHFAFELFQHFIRRRELRYTLLGAEHVPFFPNFFDVVFCLGIVYHQRDPLKCLREIRSAMKPGGKLILESQAIPGEGLEPLEVKDRYAKAHNVYFLPTAKCLRSWAEEVGFREAKIVSFSKVTLDEQRQTELAPYESLADFLDPNDSSRTVEGFPAPHRAMVIAVK